MIEKRINNDCYLVHDNAVKYVGKARTLDYDDNREFTLTGMRSQGEEDDARFVHGIATAVRCRDCASIKPTTDGRHYCQRWSHIVPLDGFCWRGEAESGEEAQEG